MTLEYGIVVSEYNRNMRITMAKSARMINYLFNSPVYSFGLIKLDGLPYLKILKENKALTLDEQELVYVWLVLDKAKSGKLVLEWRSLRDNTQKTYLISIWYNGLLEQLYTDLYKLCELEYERTYVDRYRDRFETEKADFFKEILS